jgi:5'-3' exonuclease
MDGNFINQRKACLLKLYPTQCSPIRPHPNDDNPHFQLSEEQIFTSIFAYVDLLFGKIKPKCLFFMAVDGVAPRAKMNQQRSRQFRTAKEAKELREAERKGEKLPAEKAFDTNYITPGTLLLLLLLHSHLFLLSSFDWCACTNQLT